MVGCIAALGATLVTAGSHPASAIPTDSSSSPCPTDAPADGGTPLTEAGISDLINKANEGGDNVETSLQTPEAGCTIHLTAAWPILTGKLSLTATSGPLTIDASESPGSGSGAKGIFVLEKGGDLHLSNFILTKSVESAIFSLEGSVTVSNSIIKENGEHGIQVSRTKLTVDDTAIINNQKKGVRGNDRDVITLKGSTVSGNAGGIQMGDGVGALTVTDSEISNNTNPKGDGGGVMLKASDMKMTNSTISKNTAGSPTAEAAYGGGISAFQADIAMENSTVSDNVVRSIKRSKGGGISMGSGKLTLTDSKVTGNDANASQGIESTFGGGIDNREAALTIQGDSEITDNSPNNCEKEVPGCSNK
ncbi:hypothetical protein GCM10023319_35070 [Nocardia iowensis]